MFSVFHFPAPSGCLQYFRESSGTVSSFNYVPSVSALPTGNLSLFINGLLIHIFLFFLLSLKFKTISYKKFSSSLLYFHSLVDDLGKFFYVIKVIAKFTSKLYVAATRQLANQNYGVCIRARTGYCSVTWTKPETEGNYHFTMTNDTASVAVAPGTPGTNV